MRVLALLGLVALGRKILNALRAKAMADRWSPLTDHITAPRTHDAAPRCSLRIVCASG